MENKNNGNNENNEKENLVVMNIDYVRSLDLGEFAAWMALSHKNVLEHYGIELGKEEILKMAQVYIDFFIAPYIPNNTPLNVVKFSEIKKKEDV